MPDKSNNPLNFWQELKRRKVVRVITVYAAAAFVILELVDIVAPSLGLPSWTLNLIIVLLCIGFILSIILSWIYDITPEGVLKTKPVAKDQKVEIRPTSNIWKIISYLSIVVIIGLIILNVVDDKKKTKNIAGLDKSIAVLPFDNMSTEEEYSHYGDAITDEIIMELQKVKAFDRVLSRSSTMQYKENRPTISEIAEKLGVNYLIEGSIQRYNEDVSINIQLISANPEDHIWADEFDGRWTNILSIQDEIAFEVARKLKTVLSNEEIELIEKIPTVSIEAYNLYLKGRYFWNLRTKEGVMRSIEYFMQAIELDNEYALAYSGLADAYFILSDWYYMDPDSALKKAKSFAFQSILIDSEIAEPYATLGWIFHQMSFDYELAEFMLKRSLQINPDYSSGNQYYALFLTSVGRFKEAFNYIDIALNLDPESAIINYASGLLCYFAEEYDKALFQFNQTSRINQNFPIIYYRLACYFQKEKYLDVISEYEKTLNGINIGQGFHENAIQILDNKGAYGLIRYIIELEIQKENPDRLLLPAFYTFVGENERALDILESNINDKISDFLFIMVEPAFKKLHPEPRFKKLVKSIGR